MASLHFDGDLQRIYEVPDGSTFTVDGAGYRIYTPADPTLEPQISFTAIELWSAWVDYHEANKWALLCFDRSGGEFRETTPEGDVYAVTEIRFINDWQYVPANYRHIYVLDGNVLPNLATGNHFDTDRITALPPPEGKVLFADRGQYVQLDGDCPGGSHSTAAVAFGAGASLVGDTVITATPARAASGAAQLT